MISLRRKIAACALTIAIGFGSGVAVALGQSGGLQTPAPDHPQRIPGTDMAWPKDDADCDSAWEANRWRDAIEACPKAMSEYHDVIEVLKTTPGIKPAMIELLGFNEAYTDYELASSFSAVKDDKTGHVWALGAVALYHTVTDPIGETKFKNVGATELHVVNIFGELMTRLHELYPDIVDPSAEVDL